MKLPAFQYHRPSTVAEAVGLMGELDDPKVVAGGQSLVPVLAMRLGAPAHLVDVSGIDELSRIVLEDGWIRVGAAVRQSTLERWPGLTETAPLVAAALPNIGHRAIRNRGTVCGSLAHADPAAELPVTAVVLDAEFEIAGRNGPRTVPARDFFQGVFSTAVNDDEILAAVRFPVAPPGQGAAVVEASRRSGDFAMVGAAATVTLDGNIVSSAALGLFGVGDAPARMTEVERSIVGIDITSPDPFAAPAELARNSVRPAADVNGSTAYRQQLVAVMTRRALQQAASRAGTNQ